MTAKEILEKVCKDDSYDEPYFEGGRYDGYDSHILTAMKMYAKLKCAEQRELCWYKIVNVSTQKKVWDNAPEPNFD